MTSLSNSSYSGGCIMCDLVPVPQSMHFPYGIERCGGLPIYLRCFASDIRVVSDTLKCFKNYVSLQFLKAVFVPEYEGHKHYKGEKNSEWDKWVDDFMHGDYLLGRSILLEIGVNKRDAEGTVVFGNYLAPQFSGILRV